MPFPRKKCKLHAEKVKFGSYFCVLLLFKHEIIVDSKLPGDLVHGQGARRLTHVSGRLLGIQEHLGSLGKGCQTPTGVEAGCLPFFAFTGH